MIYPCSYMSHESDLCHAVQVLLVEELRDTCALDHEHLAAHHHEERLRLLGDTSVAYKKNGLDYETSWNMSSIRPNENPYTTHTSHNT